MCNKLRTNKVPASKKNPQSLSIPEGYACIHSPIRFLGISWLNESKLQRGPVTIELHNNSVYSIFKATEEMEYSKVVTLGDAKKVSYFLRVKFSLNQNALNAALTYRNYSVGDLGIYSELDEVIDANLEALYQHVDLTDEMSQVSVKNLIQSSINRVLNNYSILNREVTWSKLS